MQNNIGSIDADEPVFLTEDEFNLLPDDAVLVNVFITFGNTIPAKSDSYFNDPQRWGLNRRPVRLTERGIELCPEYETPRV